jgi:hypothetical protein
MEMETAREGRCAPEQGTDVENVEGANVEGKKI